MEYFLFLLYGVLCCWLLTRSRFIRKSGLSQTYIVSLFLIHVAVGCFHARIIQFDNISDTWGYHKDALVEYRLLFNNPSEYFLNLFQSGYANKYAGLFEAHDSFWNDLKSNFMIKFISVMDMFSGGNYYVNLILYNFIVFFGFVSLYRLFIGLHPEKSKAILPLIFLFPSTLFFCAIIHKEGIMLLAVGFMLLHLKEVVALRNRYFYHVGWILLGCLLLFVLRNYVLFALMPVLICWILYVYFFPLNKWLVPLMVYALAGLLFFNVHYFWQALDFPELLARRQADFLQLEKANTSLSLTPLVGTFKGVLTVLPEAINHVFFKPSFLDFSMGWKMIPFFFEQVLVYLLIFISIFKFRPVFKNRFSMLLLLFACTLAILIGLIVPVLGAIIRYKSVLYPFFLLPFIPANTHIEKWHSLFNKKK